MPRVLRYTLALAVMICMVAAAFAQPSGGGAGQATPTPDGPATRPPLITNFDDILANPETAMGELVQVFREFIDDFVRVNRETLDVNLNALPVASKSTLTRVLSIALGALTLIFPNKTKVWAWLFLGAVIGLIVSQLPLGDEIRLVFARNDLDFMRDELPGTIGMIALGALAGLIVLVPAYFLAMSAAGALAGITIALRLTESVPELAGASLAIGGIVGFFIMAYVVGRGSLLVPLAVGAGLVVFGIGLGIFWAAPFMVLGGLFTVARSNQRAKLPTLTLQEGKVNVSSDKRTARAHLHEVLPAMADDRDNPLIKR